MSEQRGAASGVVALAASAGLLFVFRDVLWPLALALTFATLINALTQRLARAFPRAGRWTLFVLTASLVSVLLVVGMLAAVEGVTRILAEAPQLYHRLDELVASVRLPGGQRLSLVELGRRVELGPLAAKAANGVQNAVSGLVLTLLYLVFLLASGRMIARRVGAIVASRHSGALVTVLERSVGALQAYVYIQTLTGLMIAAASGAVMLAVGLDNWLFWALALFMLSFLPVVGVILGSLGPTIFALVQFPTLGPAIIVFVTIQTIAFVVGNLVLPKMQADSQNIDPTASLLAIGVWTILWGVPGAFLAIPLTLVIMYALAQYKSLEWIAVLISNDGEPLPTEASQTPIGPALAPERTPKA
jgi:predicted PurR-regulated permease PerM